MDNSSESFSEYYVADLQIGPRFVLKNTILVDRGQTYDNEIIMGKAVLESFALEYTKDSIRLLKDCPSGYEKVFPLIKEENRYYLNLSMNGQPHDFFLDTGSTDAIIMPLKDTIYSKGPLEMVQDTLYVGS